jgi:glycosyltransferase involved in cell wall biosynthesis
MRVLFEGFNFSQQHGGITRMWRKLLPLVAEQSPELEIALLLRSYRNASAPQHFRLKRITHFEHTALKSMAPLFDAVTKRRIEWFAPQLYHSMTYVEPPPLRGIRSIQTVYDCMHEAISGVTGYPAVRTRKREVIKSADMILAISEATKADVIDYFGIPPERIEVLHLAGDEIFSEPFDKTAEIAAVRDRFGLRDPYLLYVGLRHNYKNFTTLLKAFVESGLGKTHELVTVGGEPMLTPSQTDLLISKRLESRVRFVPHVSDEHLRALYAGATAFVYPSVKEGFGIPALEAMAAGAPTLLADIPVFREIAGDASLYFDPHESRELTELLQFAAGANANDVASQMQRGRERAGQFSWDKSAERLAAIYRNLA